MKLKNCPFCGGEAGYSADKGNRKKGNRKITYMECTSCFVLFGFLDLGNKKDTLWWWNKRCEDGK